MHVIDVIEIWGERLGKKYNATISMHKVFQRNTLPADT